MMKTLSGLALLILAGTALCDPVKTSEPCDSTDFECLKKAIRDFFSKSSLSELGTTSIDPLEIPAFDVVFDETIGVTFKLRNVVVTGLRNQKLHDFNLNEQTRKTLLAYKADLIIGADVVIDYAKKSKTFWGYFTSQPTVIGTFNSDLLVKKDDQGVNHFEFSSDTFTYTLTTSPQLDWGKDIKQELENDVAWQNQSVDTFKKFYEKTVGGIVTKAFQYEFANIKAALKVLPTTALLKN